MTFPSEDTAPVFALTSEMSPPAPTDETVPDAIIFERVKTEDVEVTKETFPLIV